MLWGQDVPHEHTAAGDLLGLFQQQWPAIQERIPRAPCSPRCGTSTPQRQCRWIKQGASSQASLFREPCAEAACLLQNQTAGREAAEDAGSPLLDAPSTPKAAAAGGSRALRARSVISSWQENDADKSLPGYPLTTRGLFPRWREHHH